MEIWKPCPMYEGVYEVSDLGRIKRVARGKGTYPGKILKHSENQFGYKFVNLTINRKSFPITVHRLVCLAFHGSPPTSSHEVAHINGVSSDCRASNLRWATHAENMADKNIHGTHNKGSAHVLARLRDEDIPLIRGMLREGKSQRFIASQYGVHRSTINNIARGTNWTHVA